MSDLFVGILLTLTVLIPIVMRPFIGNLKKEEGIAVLPLISIIMQGCIVLVFGFSLYLLPTFVFTLIIFLITLPRFIKFCVKLPTDYYSLGSLIGSVIVALLFLCVFLFSIYLRPEPAHVPEKNYTKTIYPSIEKNGRWSFYTIWTPLEKKESETKLVIFFQDLCFTQAERSTATSMLTDHGYTVVKGLFLGNTHNTSFVHSFKTRILQNKLKKTETTQPFVIDENLILIQKEELQRTLSFIKKRYGPNVKITICAEGASVFALESYVKENPLSVFDPVFLISDSEFDAFRGYTKEQLIKLPVVGPMPLNIKQKEKIVFTAPDNWLLGCGETAANDVPLAYFLGSQRDIERRQAEVVGRKIVTLLETRRSDEDSGN